MLKSQTKNYLLKHCHNLSGKTVVVTGANSGIGLCATEELIFLGAKVIMACRSLAKAQAAKEALQRDYPDADIEIRQLDLACKASIRQFADGIIADSIDIDAFVNNAGVFNISGKTADGEDIVMGTNFSGTALLADALLPYLETLPHKVKMTFTTSISYVLGDTLQAEDYSAMGGLRLYATSKLRLTRYALTLSKALSSCGSNVEVTLTHPGIAITPLASKAFGKRFMKIAMPLGKLLIQPTEKSALAIPLVIANGNVAGCIYGPDGFLCGWGYPKKNRIHRKALCK